MTRNQIANQQAQEEKRHNRAAEAQAARNEANQRAANEETARSNRAKEEEQHRANTLNAVISGGRAVSGVLSDATKLGSLLVGANDETWYIPSADTLESVATLPSPYFGGTAFDTGFYTYPGITSPKTKSAVPGVLALDVYRGPGVSKSATSAFNVACQAQYTFIRHFNSGSANYEQSDLGIYLTVVSSLFDMLATAVRAYRSAKLYSIENRYFPEALLKAEGWNLSSVVADLPGLKASICLAMQKVGAFVVPGDLNYIKRGLYLFSNVFTSDLGLGARQQMYLFRLRNFYTYALDSQGAGKANSVALTSDFTPANWKQSFDAIYDSLFADEDIGVISGDILKAYGDAAYSFEVTDFDSVIEIGTDTEALYQIMNADIHTAVKDLNVTQSSNVLFWQPKVTAYGASVEYKPKVINFFFENPHPADVMLASRFKITVDHSGTHALTSTSDYTVLSSGTELAGNAILYVYNDASGSGITLQAYTLADAIVAASTSNKIDATTIATMLDDIAYLATFRYRPMVVSALSYVESPGTIDQTSRFPFWDAEWIVNADDVTVESLNSVATFGLWNFNNDLWAHHRK